MADDDRPANKATIHGHPVYCDDQMVRNYLRKLDSEEAEVIFHHAMNQGQADFEVRQGSSRYNFQMSYDDGAYIIEGEGKESQGSGWF